MLNSPSMAPSSSANLSPVTVEPITLTADGSTTPNTPAESAEDSGDGERAEDSVDVNCAHSPSTINDSPSASSENADRLSRNIILCFDGTGNKFGQNTNVVRLFRALKKDDFDKQITYYQAGIGTYSQGQAAYTGLKSMIDTAVALGLGERVKEGYRFIMQNYRKGDKIFMFGFSRGAYIARALCGMIHKVGMLPPQNEAQLGFAFTIYQATDLEGSKLAHKFKETFAVSVEISFLGVWDTVSSVGVIPQSLPYSTHNAGVKIFRHALALDERRARFRPSIWGQPTAEREEMNLSPSHQYRKGPKDGKDSKKGGASYVPPALTDVKEVWFAGCHADVGGGYHKDEDPSNLSNISLRWMILEIYRKKTGIQFISPFLKDIGIPKNLRKPSKNKKVEDLEGAIKEIEEGLEMLKKKLEKKKAQDQTEERRKLIRGLEEDQTELRSWLWDFKEELEIAHEEAETERKEELKKAEEEIEEQNRSDVSARIHDELDGWSWWVWLGWWILEYIPMVHIWLRQKWRNLGRGRHLPWEGPKAPVMVHDSVHKRLEAGIKYTPRATNWDHLVKKDAIVYVPSGEPELL
ncbi:hypothetical protein BD779DRAFT_1507453 [Infundibulicybe gibba]|nr:hypothetical protein BD779DRAFT_1507453 [Infundibulicybe gibba]